MQGLNTNAGVIDASMPGDGAVLSNQARPRGDFATRLTVNSPISGQHDAKYICTEYSL